MHPLINRRNLIIAAITLAVLIGAVFAFVTLRSGGGEPEVSGEFVLVEASNREFDGSPALALSFSLPLDARSNYDRYIQVFEMPGDKSAKATQPKSDEDESGGDDDAAVKNPDSKVSTAAADISTEGGKLVSGAWIVGENPRLLFFPNVKPDTRFVIKVSHELALKNGTKLTAGASYSILTASVAPAYHFASNGMVLPAKQNGGLPVVTVNVPEVDVQFLRIRPDHLPKFLDRVISAAQKQTARRDGGDEEESKSYGDNSRKYKGAVNIYELDTLRSMSDSVYLGRFLTEKRNNRRAVTFLPVENIKELQEPGIYVAVMSQPGRFRYDYQATYFYVSDFGLHLRRFEKGADAYISSLTTGKAISGVEIAWLDAQGKTLAHAETDSDGRASFAERPKNAKVVIARRGQQMSMIALKEPALDLSEFSTTGGTYKPVRLFAYSGRDLYRPGESFTLSVLARDADGQPVPPQPVQAVLKRPDGKVHLSSTWQPEGSDVGYYLRRVDVPADAPTGFWKLELRADPADAVPATVFRFGVEEFLPERMKLDLSATKEGLNEAQPFKVQVRGDYLYGAPAAGNRVLGVVQYERNRNPLAAKLPGFEFGDSAEDSAKSRMELPEKALDEKGAAELDIDLASVSKRRSPYTVRATVSLLETGGRPVIRSIERTWWPAPVMVGVRSLATGDHVRENSNASFEVVRATTDGALKAGSALPVRLFRENRQYYWRFEEQRGWHSGFTETDELVRTGSVTMPAGGRGLLTVPVQYGRYRLEILDPETGKSLRYRFYAGWNARADEAQGNRPDRVALKLDKQTYREGDSVQLTITPPHAGEALVTVEGDRTLWVRRVAVRGDSHTMSIPIEKEWRRHDLYVSVLVLRPGSSGEKVTPARALGIVHLPLDRSDRKLEVAIDAPKKMVPETVMKIRVKVPDPKGDQAQVTVSAVDVGILNITRYATPDPHGFFFGRLRYGADQHDVYGRLIEKMQGVRGKLKFGGDSAPKTTRSLPKKVRLVDLFSGPVKLNAQGEAEISMPVPDFNGTLRLMAVVSGGGRYGSQEAEVTVAAPIIAELATPRFLSIGDSANLALDLHNMSGTTQDLKVKLESLDGLKIQQGERSASLKDQQKTVLRFAVDSGRAFGLATLKLAVSGRGVKFERTFPLQVQSPTPHQQVVRRLSVEPGQAITIKEADFGGLNRQTVLGHMTVSSQPPIDIRSAVQGLLTYPYGCAEQTTSTAYPHVLIDEEAAGRYGLKRYTREQRTEMLEKAIGKLAGMQASNGGFSLWGRVSEYEYWLSAYVSNFLLDARDQGFSVPETMHKKAGEFLLKALQEGVSGLPVKRPPEKDAIWRNQHYGGGGRFGVLAYGAYVLARESKAPLSTLRQLYDSRANAHSGLPLVQLGIALRLMGDEARGNAAITEGLGKARETGYWWGDYGSTLRDAALSYSLLTRHKIEHPQKENLIPQITAEMTDGKYFSTQEKLALLLVGQSFAAGAKGKWSAEVGVNGKAQKVSAQGNWFRELTTDQIASGVLLTNTHKSKLYVELAMSGNPAKMPPLRADPITLTRTMFTPDGKPLDGKTLKTGETIIVKIDVQSKVEIANAMVIDHIPAGIEIENMNLVKGESMGTVKIDKLNPAEAMNDPRIKHTEFRDDRFVVAVRLDRYYGSGKPLTLFYRARVVTPGRFVYPPLYAEDMYRPNIFGLSGAGGTLTVTDAPAR